LKDKFDKHARLDNNESENVEDQWRIIKNNMHNVVEKVLGCRKRVPKKKWIISEIFNMMEKKKLIKRNMQKYNQIHRNICCKIRKAKN